MEDIPTVKLRGLTGPQLEALSRKRVWSLKPHELLAIRNYFKKQRRDPTGAEMETLAQTWSEHCKHKTFTSPIVYREGKKRRRIKNLLAETIMKATREVKTSLCLSVFKDNAGVIAFDKDWALAYKVETHNHPCAIEPYGGAQTGVGGVIRDILGAGRGAKPILNTDVFCFASPDLNQNLPEGVLHPRRILKSVVAGVRDYGNRMGIPTAGGALWFDPGYVYNPLVFCGSLGLLPRKAVEKKVCVGDRIVAVGGRTGRDGIHGATFSSEALDVSSDVSAVQIGHAIAQKKMLDVLLQARDGGFYRSVTDCGAGGFSSAIGELAASCGARVYLEKALLKYEGLKPWEIWLSESQERMVLAVPSEKVRKILDLFSSEDVEAVVLGEFTSTGRLEVFYAGQPIVNLEMKFLHHGLPRKEQSATWSPPKKSNKPQSLGSKLQARVRLYQNLSDWNTCSREWIIRQYDHEVQGATLVKPLQGQDGPGDACVLWPLGAMLSQESRVKNRESEARDSQLTTRNSQLSYRGIAVAHGINPEYGKKDPAAMAEACVDEALRNLVCVGADLDQSALLDNFCWGDTSDPRQMGYLVRAALGCYRAAKIFKVPFISGKDSLNNVYQDSLGNRHSIPGTLLISAVGIVPDVRRALTMNFKGPGNSVYLVGETKMLAVPRVQVSARDVMRALSHAIQGGWVLSCHDLSEGGLAVTLSEMAFAGGYGVEIHLKDENMLFSEDLTRFLVEVSPEKEEKFARAMKGCVFSRLGVTLATPVVRVRGAGGDCILEEPLADLKAAWQKPFMNLMEPKKQSYEAQNSYS
ncbi:MAG: phosphoribosylformylglycinamidine synthase [Elusimicrobia bacterium]|nr:phosphoribosylformylglycinamidine synthase [Elusimicrobiota bacterium]